jgi:hypothetical protein
LGLGGFLIDNRRDLGIIDHACTAGQIEAALGVGIGIGIAIDIDRELTSIPRSVG